jgi:hypothetical protein
MNKLKEFMYTFYLLLGLILLEFDQSLVFYISLTSEQQFHPKRVYTSILMNQPEALYESVGGAASHAQIPCVRGSCSAFRQLKFNCKCH